MSRAGSPAAGAPAAGAPACNIGLPDRNRASIELNMRHTG